MSLFDLLNSVADVDDLIASGQRESETLEYKDASKRLQSSDHGELAKDASAFANTLGGVIIYGVSTDANDVTLLIKCVPIDPKNIGIIERVIASNIRHPLEQLAARGGGRVLSFERDKKRGRG